MAHDGEHATAWSIDGHRREVVQRLLARGLSPHVLQLLLPEFGDAVAGDAIAGAGDATT